MSRGRVIGIAALAVLGCGAGGYYWVRERSARSAQASASPFDSEPKSAPPRKFPQSRP